jgi:cell division protein FtsQ
MRNRRRLVFNRRNRKRKPQKKRQLNLPVINWSQVFTLVAVGAVIVAGYVSTIWLMNRPIDAVVINGAFQRVSAIQLEEALARHVHTGFLSADLNAMRTQLIDIPWVANAAIRRRWPGSIEVLVTEQRPAACWGERGLLNVDGVLFISNASHTPAELPRLDGPAGTEAKVAAMYFHIEKQLEQRGMAAVSLILDGRGAWNFQLNNGIRVRLGASQVDERIDRFLLALDGVISSQAEYVDYVDMRYTNGFAIGWKGRNPSQASIEKGSRPHA